MKFHLSANRHLAFSPPLEKKVIVVNRQRLLFVCYRTAAPNLPRTHTGVAVSRRMQADKQEDNEMLKGRFATPENPLVVDSDAVWCNINVVHCSHVLHCLLVPNVQNSLLLSLHNCIAGDIWDSWKRWQQGSFSWELASEALKIQKDMLLFFTITCLFMTVEGQRVKTQALSALNSLSLSLMTGLCHRKPGSWHCCTHLIFYSSVCPSPRPYSSQI